MRPQSCPRCGAELHGGPVLYRCAACVRAVYAADLNTDYHPTRRTS